MTGAPPKNATGAIIDPFTKHIYNIECRTYNCELQATTISLKRQDAKPYFDSERINGEQLEGIDGGMEDGRGRNIRVGRETKEEVKGRMQKC